MDKEELEDLIDQFRELDFEAQDRVIQKMAKDNEDAAEALRGIQKIQKSRKRTQKRTKRLKKALS